MKNATKKKAEVRDGTKSAKVIKLLERPTGATNKEMMKATGWQTHSVRGFLAGFVKKKMGLRLARTERPNGDNAYLIKRRASK